MHFKSNSPKVTREPCPYHSQKKSEKNSPRIPKYSQSGIRTRSKRLHTTGDELQLPKLSRNYRFESSSPDEQSLNRLLFQHQYRQFGKKMYPNFNYYEDETICNSDYTRKRQHPIQQSSIIKTAHKRVQQIYHDEYYNVREQLDIINRINARHQVLINIKRDKMRLERALQQRKKASIEFAEDGDDGEVRR